MTAIPPSWWCHGKCARLKQAIPVILDSEVATLVAKVMPLGPIPFVEKPVIIELPATAPKVPPKFNCFCSEVIINGRIFPLPVFPDYAMVQYLQVADEPVMVAIHNDDNVDAPQHEEQLDEDKGTTETVATPDNVFNIADVSEPTPVSCTGSSPIFAPSKLTLNDNVDAPQHEEQLDEDKGATETVATPDNVINIADVSQPTPVSCTGSSPIFAPSKLTLNVNNNEVNVCKTTYETSMADISAEHSNVSDSSDPKSASSPPISLFKENACNESPSENVSRAPVVPPMFESGTSVSDMLDKMSKNKAAFKTERREDGEDVRDRVESGVVKLANRYAFLERRAVSEAVSTHAPRRNAFSRSPSPFCKKSSFTAKSSSEPPTRPEWECTGGNMAVSDEPFATAEIDLSLSEVGFGEKKAISTIKTPVKKISWRDKTPDVSLCDTLEFDNDFSNDEWDYDNGTSKNSSLTAETTEQVAESVSVENEAPNYDLEVTKGMTLDIVRHVPFRGCGRSKNSVRSGDAAAKHDKATASQAKPILPRKDTLRGRRMRNNESATDSNADDDTPNRLSVAEERNIESVTADNNIPKSALDDSEGTNLDHTRSVSLRSCGRVKKTDGLLDIRRRGKQLAKTTFSRAFLKTQRSRLRVRSFDVAEKQDKTTASRAKPILPRAIMTRGRRTRPTDTTPTVDCEMEEMEGTSKLCIDESFNNEEKNSSGTEEPTKASEDIVPVRSAEDIAPMKRKPTVKRVRQVRKSMLDEEEATKVVDDPPQAVPSTLKKTRKRRSTEKEQADSSIQVAKQQEREACRAAFLQVVEKMGHAGENKEELMILADDYAAYDLEEKMSYTRKGRRMMQQMTEEQKLAEYLKHRDSELQVMMKDFYKDVYALDKSNEGLAIAAVDDNLQSNVDMSPVDIASRTARRKLTRRMMRKSSKLHVDLDPSDVTADKCEEKSIHYDDNPEVDVVVKGRGKRITRKTLSDAKAAEEYENNTGAHDTKRRRVTRNECSSFGETGSQVKSESSADNVIVAKRRSLRVARNQRSSNGVETSLGEENKYSVVARSNGDEQRDDLVVELEISSDSSEYDDSEDDYQPPVDMKPRDKRKRVDGGLDELNCVTDGSTCKRRKMSRGANSSSNGKGSARFDDSDEEQEDKIEAIIRPLSDVERALCESIRAYVLVEEMKDISIGSENERCCAPSHPYIELTTKAWLPFLANNDVRSGSGHSENDGAFENCMGVTLGKRTAPSWLEPFSGMVNARSRRIERHNVSEWIDSVSGCRDERHEKDPNRLAARLVKSKLGTDTASIAGSSLTWLSPNSFTGYATLFKPQPRCSALTELRLQQLENAAKNKKIPANKRKDYTPAKAFSFIGNEMDSEHCAGSSKNLLEPIFHTESQEPEYIEPQAVPETSGAFGDNLAETLAFCIQNFGTND